MNRITSYLLALLMCLGLGACLPDGGSGAQNVGGHNADGGVVVLQNPTDDWEPASDPKPSTGNGVSENGRYTDKDRVALYIHTYGHLPANYITKREAEELGWESSRGNLHDVAPGMSIGGDRFGNYEGQLPKLKGRRYFECDIDYTGGKRNAKRIVFSSDGLIYYTGNHYKTFSQMY